MAWNFSSIQELTLTLITESNLSAMLMLLVCGVVVAELRGARADLQPKVPYIAGMGIHGFPATGKNRRRPAIERPSSERWTWELNRAIRRALSDAGEGDSKASRDW